MPCLLPNETSRSHVGATALFAPPEVIGTWEPQCDGERRHDVDRPRRAGASRRHRRRRDERDRVDPARPRRRRGLRVATRRTLGPCWRCARSAPGSKWGTPPRTCPTPPPPSSSPPLSARRTRSWPPPGSAACRWCTGPGAGRAHRRAPGGRCAGTHGKTSTTSMVTVALQHCGFDPSFAIGGDLASSGAGAHHGEAECVVEADESDGSFTAFAPDVAVVTNVEPDRLDHHGTEAEPARRSPRSSTGSDRAGCWWSAPTIRVRRRWANTRGPGPHRPPLRAGGAPTTRRCSSSCPTARGPT